MEAIRENYLALQRERMNSFRMQGIFCDVRFRVGDQVFPAHRVVLAARAEVLLEALHINILDHDDDEEIVLQNVDVDVLRQTLDFIYWRQNEITKIPAA